MSLRARHRPRENDLPILRKLSRLDETSISPRGLGQRSTITLIPSAATLAVAECGHCGRFRDRTPASETTRIFGTKNAVPNWPPRYNIAPTDGVLTVLFNREKQERSLDVLRRGLIPFWAKDAKARLFAHQCPRRRDRHQGVGPSGVPEPRAAYSSFKLRRVSGVVPLSRTVAQSCSSSANAGCGSEVVPGRTA